MTSQNQYLRKNAHEYAEQERIEIVRDFLDSGSTYEAIGEKYGLGRMTVWRWVNKYRSVAVLKDGQLPMGHDIRGTSTLYDAEGNVKIQWVKTNKDADRAMEIMQETIEAMKAEIPKAAPTQAPAYVENDLLSTYIVTDYHFGQLSVKEEVGEDWDMAIAEKTLLDWFTSAIELSPQSHTAVLCQLGDFLHWDGLEAMTPTSHHMLDASTRYGPMVNVIIRVLRQIVDMLLTKHQHVHIIMAEGNHDLASSVWLRALFAEKYHDDPRVTVDNSHIPYYAYQWGSTSLFFHHGHKAKISQISEAMTAQFREMVGMTKYSYAHMGHYHHIDVKETRLMVVEQHPTLAAKDAYSARGAYTSQRSASVITYSKQFGEVSRLTVRPEMLGANGFTENHDRNSV